MIALGGSTTAAARVGDASAGIRDTGIRNAAVAAPMTALRSIDVPVSADVTVGPDIDAPLGDDPVLTVDASPARVTYLRFDLGAFASPIASAVLHLRVARPSATVIDPSSSSAGLASGSSDDTWAEAATTWANRPAVDGPFGDVVGAVTPGQWVAFDVTRPARGGGSVTIALSSDDADGVRYDSRESGADAPFLTVQIGWSPRAVAGSVVVAAVGDMACPPGEVPTISSCHAREVSDSIIHDPDISALFALGDLQYPTGSLADFQGSYARSYGRLQDLTSPVVGNHEYGTPGASGYFSFFGAAAGDPTQGWTSRDIGTTWHVVTLNSNCSIVSCAAGSPQETWMRADLATSTRPCTIVMWHHPRFSSGQHGDDPAVAPLWQAATDAHVDVVLTGHDHTYERFAPQTNDRTVSATAPREFVVGTGGRSLYSFPGMSANSEVRISGEFGHLRLTLDPGGYRWAFVAADGRVLDSGSETCRA